MFWYWQFINQVKLSCTKFVVTHKIQNNSQMNIVFKFNQPFSSEAGWIKALGDFPEIFQVEDVKTEKVLVDDYFPDVILELSVIPYPTTLVV